ncbi:FKBP-type peptidyl-prolyl cis-trans isomerase [Robiginitomaculum antarcticum]|uniref:FKBP-type peptidyl-prolyl cis-trans isomerase n=1 Tax=Robiginitomaculum antarcticum TaxID=437507 RepID=UPI0003722744|nr:peptidylprolyl isomerase [Robiginitomaculum antarcticum]
MQNIIGFHYTLKDKDGAVLDSSEGQPPMLVMTGAQQIIPGLEKELMKMKKGEKQTVVIAPENAYGPVQEDMKLTVKREQFPEGAQLHVGQQFKINQEPQAPVFTVTAIKDDNIHIDGNHPMAGKELHFDVDVTEKRMPTPDELAHGHAHGPGGHHH